MTILVCEFHFNKAVKTFLNDVFDEILVLYIHLYIQKTLRAHCIIYIFQNWK